MNRFKSALLATMVVLSPFANAESEPAEFGHYFSKNDIRSVTSQQVEVRFCSLPNCPWVSLKTQPNIWAIHSESIAFGQYLEEYLKSPIEAQHFFFINKVENRLVYTSLYGHQQEEIDIEAPETIKQTGEQ